jgi:diaminohydroxyphosphoribosylaminopyrimidine deaminase/5-amino-6-(5-phosphoribosylamino)uracil reductase
MTDLAYLRLALRLAKRGCGQTSPNPMVGALLVKHRRIIGRGWHRRAGGPHAEIEAIRDAQERGHNPHGATLYVTLEPCCTHGRTPPCTGAIAAAGVKRVVAGGIDPNPRHSGKGLKLLQRAGVDAEVFAVPRSRGWESESSGHRLKTELQTLNEAFNHWIVHRTPFVTVKAAMTLDGKIATAKGESKWITGIKARAFGMKLRKHSDAVLVGVNTVLADDPSLVCRLPRNTHPKLRRVVLDSKARTPLAAKVVSDEHAKLTTIVVGKRAPKQRVEALAKRVNVLVAPLVRSKIRNARSEIDLHWLLKKLGSKNVTSLLVEGGGEVNASFLFGGQAHRVAFFYAPKVLGGQVAKRAVAGTGLEHVADVTQLYGLKWRRLGEDLLLLANLTPPRKADRYSQSPKPI